MSKIRPKKTSAENFAKSDLKATTSTISTRSGDTAARADSDMLYHKGNYMIILAGLGLIFLGYLLMSGGHQTDPNVFDEDVIYSTRRTLIAPILILAGLGLEVWAVFKR